VPRGIRYVAVTCLILSAMVGYFAAAETWVLFRPEDQGQQSPLLQPDNPELRQALDEKTKQAEEARRAAFASMRDARAVTLAALSVACALAFVGATRILRPFGLPREGVRRLLVIAASAAAILRTVDGAESAVAFKRYGQTLGQAFQALPKVDEAKPYAMLAPLLPRMGVGIAVGLTILVAGAFGLVSQYFRSERVKKIVEFRDAHPE
jgi:hypothetical protein